MPFVDLESYVSIKELVQQLNYYFPIFPHLTEYRCIIFNNYSAGRSSLKLDIETIISIISKDILSLLDFLKVYKPIVIEYSISKIVPSYLALSYSNRVIVIVLIDLIYLTL
jgi:pimeloyl-ACP methyl ester carboxylesterase